MKRLIGWMAVFAPVLADDVSARAAVDRTAMWVADRATYTVEITCRNGVDIVADDLSREKLKLTGLEIVDVVTDRVSGPDRSTMYRVRYVLTTYRTDVALLEIAPLSVRYAITRSRPEDAAPAGEVQVPGATIAFRSVLPDGQDPSGIRADKPPRPRPARFAALQSIGIGLVIVSVVPALFGIAALVSRVRPRPRRRSVRVARQGERLSLDTVRAKSIDTIEARREVFADLDVLVRAHLTDVHGLPGASLTPEEVPLTVAAEVLATCEIARYAPPSSMPSAAACRETLERVEQIVIHQVTNSPTRQFSRF